MEKLSIPPDAIPFIESLRGLIRTGVTASPSLETSKLVDLLVVRQRCGKEASPTKRASIFIMTLKQIVKHRLEGRESTVANILFALDDYAGMPPQDRYRLAAKVYNKYWTWENFRKEPLTRFLLAVYLALTREAELTPPLPHFGEPTNTRSSGLIGQDWALDSFHGVYTFPKEPGHPLEILQTRKLRAISNIGANVWRHQVHWRERGVSGVPDITLHGPGSVSVIDSYLDEYSGVRVFVTEVRLPRTIAYGEMVEIVLSKRVQVKHNVLLSASGQDWYGLLPLSSPMEHARVGLRFPPNKKPRTIWRHQDIMSGLIRPNKPTQGDLLNVDASGYVECAWSELSAGMSYGVAFSW